MTTPFDQPMLSPWQEEGRRRAEALDRSSFVMVLGDDPQVAAELALGIGRAQARRRRVAILDAVGELDAIEDLSPVDTPHGIFDVFVHGVSLNNVAHQVDAAGNMHIVPSGPVPVDYDTLFASTRWEGMAREFREAEALLLVIAPDGNMKLDRLLSLVDGVVLVGRAQPVPGVRALLYVGAPGQGTPLTLPSNAPRPTLRAERRSGERSSGSGRPPGERTSGGVRRTPPRMVVQPPGTPWLIWLAAIALVAVVFGGSWWATRKPSAASTTAAPPAHGGSVAHDSSRGRDSAGRAAAAAAAIDSAHRATTDSTAVADSNARAAAWTVELWRALSVTEANVFIEQDALRGLPALTSSPVTDSAGDRTYRVSVGASSNRAPADSLLAALRARGVLSAGDGSVVRLPFAVLVQSGVTRDQASFYATGLRTKGIPVYPLFDDSGLARLYAGAFERREDAELMVGMLRSNGETASVTYRIGRIP